MLLLRGLVGTLIVRDRRGGTLVEYLILVGLVALVAAAGLRALGKRIQEKVAAQAACIATLSCDSGGSSTDSETTASGGGPRGEPAIPTRAQVDAAIAAANSTGDLHALDSIDRFRQRLSPELQREYDALLQQLRDDERIQIRTEGGTGPNPGRDDLILRGIAAATFGRPELLEDTIQTAVDSRLDGGRVVEDGEGTLDIFVHPDSFAINLYYPGTNTDRVPGLVSPTSDVAISEAFLYDTVAAGEHLLIHEFSHSLQQASDDGDVAQQRDFPEDFDEDVVNDAMRDDAELQQLFLDTFGVVHTNLEVFPSLQVLFETQPARLQAASPEVYEAFVEYHDLDPLTGRHAD